MRLTLADEAATQRLGAALAATRPPQAVAYLHGDLGAGKSTLARALLRALGVSGPIRSPTYTLIEPYRLDDGGQAIHLDLYRIAAPDELEFLGLDALSMQATLWLVEWPERGAGALPAADLRIGLSPLGAGRLAALQAHTPAGEDWLERLSKNANLHDMSTADSR
ncbi:MAG: tRNA (adenosine(37)-N6)-threonylcarbamoyltransferase complex ATPase subunit type 1 TsaE [Proteobacteria bacterium]|nr:tRNA (adenosine(37)-N6)-threonylcarbamoyltransferase complex ATPase subunit type 1 TsaE [Pseudomonadota bacterium]